MKDLSKYSGRSGKTGHEGFHILSFQGFTEVEIREVKDVDCLTNWSLPCSSSPSSDIMIRLRSHQQVDKAMKRGIR